MRFCRIHRTINCKICADPRLPKNEFRHRMKRREIGITSCTTCNDSGHINIYTEGSSSSRIDR